ncbi:hypothetical protein jhhlp_002804 [Lomentospora prolificans]|uniref:Uncharacterized protein n=1 Tax=Lomentospora prolificans TaxID=41688 RepID=A0A2N3NF30_9PEZI|nr:hypothetical protein jhhlp_002804 [Lomentospora prolificans]
MDTSVVSKEWATTATATSTGAGGGGGGGEPRPSGDAEPVIVVSWPVDRSVLANHVPLIVARVFTSFVAGAYRDIGSFEPIRQLFSVDGASGPALAGAAVTLIPIVLSGFVAEVGSGFAAEAVFLDTNYCTEPMFSDSLNPCWPPRVSTNRWALTVLTTSLGVVAVSFIYIVALWLRTPQSVTMETTSSIAAVASVMGHPEVERDFSTVPSELSNKGLVEHLKDKKYTMGNYAIEEIGTRFGIMPLILNIQKKKRRSVIERVEGNWADLTSGNEETHSNWMRRRQYFDYALGIVFFALLGLSIAAVAYVDDPRRIFRYSTREWTIGIRITFALLAIAIAKYWSTAFTDVQNLSHYARLHRGPCDPRETINKKSYALPIVAIFPLARMGYMVPAAVAFTALLSEFLVICLAGLPYRPGQLRTEYLACGIISIVMLVIMLVMTFFLHRWRKTLPHLPRRPDSVAAVMTYVAETNMSRDFMSIEERKRKERERTIEGLGKKYGYGVRVEEDGRKRWVVDEVEIEYEAERRRMVVETEYMREGSAN